MLHQRSLVVAQVILYLFFMRRKRRSKARTPKNDQRPLDSFMLPRVWEVWEKYLEVREKKERRESSGKAAKPGYSPTQTHTHNIYSLWPHYSTDIWHSALLSVTQIHHSSASWEIA